MDCNLRKHSEQRFCCGGCHRAFSSMEAFDWHRKGRSCVDPADGDFVPQTIRGVIGDVVVWGGRVRAPLEQDQGATITV